MTESGNIDRDSMADVAAAKLTEQYGNIVRIHIHSCSGYTFCLHAITDKGLTVKYYTGGGQYYMYDITDGEVSSWNDEIENLVDFNYYENYSGDFTECFRLVTLEE